MTTWIHLYWTLTNPSSRLSKSIIVIPLYYGLRGPISKKCLELPSINKIKKMKTRKKGFENFFYTISSYVYVSNFEKKLLLRNFILTSLSLIPIEVLAHFMRSLYWKKQKKRGKKSSLYWYFFGSCESLLLAHLCPVEKYLHNFSFELLHLNRGWLQSILFWWKACLVERLKNEQNELKEFRSFFSAANNRARKYRKGMKVNTKKRRRYLEVLNNEILFTVGNLLYQIAALRHGVMLMKNFRFISRPSMLPLYCSFTDKNTLFLT